MDPAAAIGADRVHGRDDRAGAGSDAAAIKTRAVVDGDDYLINGEKVFSSSMGYAGLAMVAVRTDPQAEKHRGITMFLVDPRSPGIDEQLDTLGDWSVGTYQVFYNDVRADRETSSASRTAAGSW